MTSYGESHGPAIGGVVDGCPPGLALSEQDLQPELQRRRPGQSKFTTQRRETDQVEILSGIFNGKTTGAPIGFIIRNTDSRSKDYDAVKSLFRPGHADFTYQAKYGNRDYRGGGRSSARTTAVLVAAGAIAKKYLRLQYKTKIFAHIVQVGEVQAASCQPATIEDNPFFCADPEMVAKLEELFAKLRKENDSVGACVQLEATGVPLGIGSPIFAKLDADLAAAMLGINAAKGVEIGAGFAAVAQRGSEHRDEMVPSTAKEGAAGQSKVPAVEFLSNNAGGVLGGISSGQPLIVRVAFKPTSSILKPGRTIDENSKTAAVVVKGRHDPCVGIRAVPIVEASAALVLMDQLLLHRAQCGGTET